MNRFKATVEQLERRDTPSSFTPPASAILTHHDATPAIADPWAMQAMHEFIALVPAKPAYDQADFKVGNQWQESVSTDGQTWSDPVPAAHFALVLTTVNGSQAVVTVDASAPGTGFGFQVPQATAITTQQTAPITIASDQAVAFADLNAAWKPDASLPLFTATVSGALSLDVQAPAGWTVVVQIVQSPATVQAPVPLGLNAASLGQFYALQAKSSPFALVN